MKLNYRRNRTLRKNSKSNSRRKPVRSKSRRKLKGSKSPRKSKRSTYRQKPRRSTYRRKPVRSKSRRKPVRSKSRRKSQKKIDSGDFRDTGLFNITNKTILDLPKHKLLSKYDDLIKYLNIRKRQLEIDDKSTRHVDTQLEAAKLEKKYLLDNYFSPYSVSLRMLNNMP